MKSFIVVPLAWYSCTWMHNCIWLAKRISTWWKDISLPSSSAYESVDICHFTTTLMCVCYAITYVRAPCVHVPCLCIPYIHVRCFPVPCVFVCLASLYLESLCLALCPCTLRVCVCWTLSFRALRLPMLLMLYAVCRYVHVYDSRLYGVPQLQNM